MSCDTVRPYLQAFVDHELSPERAISVQQHLSECPPCADEVELTRELMNATRISVTESPMCPEFHARLCQCLAHERKRQEKQSSEPLSWKAIAPLAAAVALALFFSYRSSPFLQRVAGPTTSSLLSTDEPWTAVSESHVAAQENLVDFLVRNHTKRFEPELSEPVSVKRFEPELGFAVRPPDFGRYGARFEGAQLLPVRHGGRAAVLRYDMGGRRVSLYVYNPDEMPLIRQRNLQPRVIGNRAVFVGRSKGYSIATCERHGVGYAVTADLSDDESAELVATLDQ